MSASIRRMAVRRGLASTLFASGLVLASCGVEGPSGPAATTGTTGPTATTSSSTPPQTSSTSATTSPGATTSPTATSSGATTSSIAGAASPEKAIEVWMAGEGFTYAGDCGATTIEDDLGKYCSSFCKDRGSRQIFKIGPTFSEYTTWLLLEESGGSWRVIDTARDTGTAPPPW